MKFSSVALCASLSSSALAFAGMKGGEGMMDFHKSLVRKAQSGAHLGKRNTAQLPALGNSTKTDSAKQISDCLDGSISCEAPAQKTYVAPALGSAECDADTCCIWDYIVTDLIALFTDSNGQCNEAARQAIRLGFHDAGAWSTSSGFGGADGSMLISDEITRPENKGLENIVITGQGLLGKYTTVGAADLVQMMANVATVVCPLGPRVLSWVGRPDSANSPEDLLPGAFSDADTLLTLFSEKTISADDLVALVGAHTTSHQDFVDPSNAGSFQDSTPGVWDTVFYSETLDASFSESDITKFPSDVALANDPRTNGAWQAMNNPQAWNAAYARAYVRVSLLGVAGLDNLTDCSKVLPSVKNGGPPGGSGGKPSGGSGGKPSGSAKASGKPTASVSGKPYGGSGDSDVTTTVTSYYTQNGWHVPVHTSVCNKDDLPSWANTPEWVFSDVVTAWAVPTGPAPTSPPTTKLAQPSCVVKTVYVTTTVW